MDNNSNKPENLQVFETIQKIKDGRLDPIALSKEARHLCVEALLFEGYHTSSIAKLMKKSDRTIRRDIEEIRQKNALKSNPELTGILAGELLANGRNQYSRLKQLARLPETSSEDKAKIEFLAWRVYSELIDVLFYIGFLPKKGLTDVVVSGVIDDDVNLTQAEKELKRFYSLMTPIERQMLIDRLDQQIAGKNQENHQNDQNNNGEENKKGESPPQEGLLE